MRSPFLRPSSSGRPWAPNFTSWISNTLGFQGLPFLYYISHSSPAEFRFIVYTTRRYPLSGAEEKTARAISAHAQCACLLSL